VVEKPLPAGLRSVIEDGPARRRCCRPRRRPSQGVWSVVGPPGALVLPRSGARCARAARRGFEQDFSAPESGTRAPPGRASWEGTPPITTGAARSLCSGHHIDRQADQHRWGQVEDFVEHRADAASQTRRPVGASGGQQDAWRAGEVVAMGPWMGLKRRRMKEFNPARWLVLN